MGNPEQSRDLKSIIDSYNKRRSVLVEKMGIQPYHDWVLKCDAEISKVFPNLADRQQYQLWHILVGGGAPEVPYFDFEGEISIEKLIAEKEREYAQKEKNKNAGEV